MNKKSSKQPSSSEIWNKFIQDQCKKSSKLGKIFEKAEFGSYEQRILLLYLPDEESLKKANEQKVPLKNKLPFELSCVDIEFHMGEAPVKKQESPKEEPPHPIIKTANRQTVNRQIANPLQELHFAEFGYDRKGEELVQPVLKAAVEAEKTCEDIYKKLADRTEKLAGKEEFILKVSFNWRVRVGGTRGFRELLLPVFHPVFGIPYIPASSLKGAARSWARSSQGQDIKKIQELLGMLEGSEAKAAKVEILDAFPTKPCLSVDVATPQWHWQNDRVKYDPKPHPLLSMEQPQLRIGLRPTSKGTADDVLVVKEWLKNALKTGIGSRVSSGYGRALGAEASSTHSQVYNFELWTQGMYGSEPPSKENEYQGKAEFRPTAIRGILRYWFRAVALGLYDSKSCQKLEDELFGNLGKPGQISISTVVNSKENPSPSKEPYFYNGRICLEASSHKSLQLASKLLILASHLGGVGRGSRRPLHLLNGRMRGCHWEIQASDLPLECDAKAWQNFFYELREAFKNVRSPLGNHIVYPGSPKQRQQDVLDENAQIWLLRTPKLKPDDVKNWSKNGDSQLVKGNGLNLLYSSGNFKGKNIQKVGNDLVGGDLGTPSYVWIKSIFPDSNNSYQVVTIIGAEDSDRQAFVQALQKQNAIIVFGQKHSVGDRSVGDRQPDRKKGRK